MSDDEETESKRATATEDHRYDYWDEIPGDPLTGLNWMAVRRGTRLHARGSDQDNVIIRLFGLSHIDWLLAWTIALVWTGIESTSRLITWPVRLLWRSRP